MLTRTQLPHGDLGRGPVGAGSYCPVCTREATTGIELVPFVGKFHSRASTFKMHFQLLNPRTTNITRLSRPIEYIANKEAREPVGGIGL